MIYLTNQQVTLHIIAQKAAINCVLQIPKAHILDKMVITTFNCEWMNIADHEGEHKTFLQNY